MKLPISLLCSKYNILELHPEFQGTGKVAGRISKALHKSVWLDPRLLLMQRGIRRLLMSHKLSSLCYTECQGAVLLEEPNTEA